MGIQVLPRSGERISPGLRIQIEANWTEAGREQGLLQDDPSLVTVCVCGSSIGSSCFLFHFSKMGRAERVGQLRSLVERRAVGSQAGYLSLHQE